ncbi:hypothetical protein HRF68_22690, partial [Pseudomonas stutzeri]|nr:hypothetical protein [Stutzerimonas stutzeri]
PHIENSGDFRLVDRSILDQLRMITDPDPYVRGLISELAANQTTAEFARNIRQHGESKFPLRQLVRLALVGLYAHSTAPLKLATYAGPAVYLVHLPPAGRLYRGVADPPRSLPRRLRNHHRADPVRY